MTKKVDIEAEVRAVNLALKADCYSVAIRIRGKKLVLVATLPPKFGSTKRKPYQQRIPTKQGSTRRGLKRAKVQALILGDQLERDMFSWDYWINVPADDPIPETCGYWLAKFKAHVWPKLPEDKEFNWRKRFLYFGFNKLPLDAPLTPELLIEAALTKPESKKAARDKTCARLQRLADFAGIDVNLSYYKAGYSAADTTPRNIPPDPEIERLIDSIKDPHWQYVFALMATYGLRNHEAFLCKLQDKSGVIVANVPPGTKTGQRIAYPHPKEWVERWNLLQGQPPQINVRAPQEYGQKASEHWRKLKAPGTPYGLRHAYAIRCHYAGAAVAIAAKWMGHSPETHLRIYQRWISETLSREAWGNL